MRIQDRISSIVESQLPEHVRSSYPLFVRFIELYYEFLEQDQGAYEIINNAKSYLDIDRTTDSFIQYFLNTYCKGVPGLASVDKSILVKRISDLYEAKGSELSFQLLFKLLYNESIEIRYPYENVLKPSDGIWDQKISIHVLKSSGDANLFKNHIAVYKKNNIRYEFAVSRLKSLNNNYYELFLETKYNVIPFEIGNPVLILDESDNVLFNGTVAPTATNYVLLQNGAGFKVGQIFTINFGGSVDMIIKILKVSADGSIELIQIVNFGYGYTDEFTVEIHNDLDFAISSSLFLTKTNGFKEDIAITKFWELTDPNRYFASDYVRYYTAISLPYAEVNTGSTRYFSDNTYTAFNVTYSNDIYQNYVAESIANFTDDQTVSGGDFDVSNTPDVALIQFSLGAKAKYPGQYLAYRGFISEQDVRLQDDKLFQPFAYQIQSSIDIQLFYDVVKGVVHQAGTNLFADKTILNVIDVSNDIDSALESNLGP